MVWGFMDSGCSITDDRFWGLRDSERLGGVGFQGFGTLGA